MGQESRHSLPGSSVRLQSRCQPGPGSHPPGGSTGEELPSKFYQLLPQLFSVAVGLMAACFFKASQGEKDTQNESSAR